MRTGLGCGLLAGSMLLGAWQAPVTQHEAPEPGTYRLILCADPCRPSEIGRAVATATVVIIERADLVNRAALDALPIKALESRSRQAAPVPNACFKVTQHARTVGTEPLQFGIIPGALTTWEGNAAAGFSMRVYQSIDASYSLRWSRPGAFTQGEGWSLSAPDHPVHRNAYFAAERTGPPDPAQCK